MSDDNRRKTRASFVPSSASRKGAGKAIRGRRKHGTADSNGKRKGSKRKRASKRSPAKAHDTPKRGKRKKSAKKKGAQKAAKKTAKKAAKKAAKKKVARGAPKPKASKPAKSGAAKGKKLAARAPTKGAGKGKKAPPKPRKKAAKAPAKKRAKKAATRKAADKGVEPTPTPKGKRAKAKAAGESVEIAPGIVFTPDAQITERPKPQLALVGPKPKKRAVTIPDKGEEVSIPGLSAESRLPTTDSSVKGPRKLAKNIYFVQMEDFGGYSEDKPLPDGEERFTTSTSGAHRNNDNYAELFRAAFYDFLEKTPFSDVNDVPFFRWGIAARSLTPRKGEAIQELAQRTADMMSGMLPPGASAHIVDEGKYLSVRLNLGSYTMPSTFDEAYNYIQRNRSLFDNFREGVRELWEDFVWFEFWDTDELYYEGE